MMKLKMILAATMLCGLATSASAAAISGLGDPLTNAALAGGTQEGFDSTASGQYNSITIGGVTYSGIGAALTIGSDFNGDYNTTGGKSMFNDFDYRPDAFRFDFSGTVTAFGFNWGAADNNWLLQAFDAGGALIDSALIAGTFASNAGEYVGLSTGTAIAYAILTDQKNNFTEGDYVFIDRFTTNGTASAVPVPAALPLLLSGLGALGFAGWRKKKAAA